MLSKWFLVVWRKQRPFAHNMMHAWWWSSYVKAPLDGLNFLELTFRQFCPGWNFLLKFQNDERALFLMKSRLGTVHWRASGPLWRAFGILWLCYFAWRAEKWAKQTNWLPISAIHKQPPLILGGQKRRPRGPEARQSTVLWGYFSLTKFRVG